MYDLSWSAHECLFEGGEIEAIDEAFAAAKARFERFLLDWPELESLWIELSEQYPDDPKPQQIHWLSARGIALCREGFERLKSQLEGEEFGQEIFESIVAVMDGNDHLTLATIMASEANALPEENADDLA